jgi:hypothetical protein
MKFMLLAPQIIFDHTGQELYAMGITNGCGDKGDKLNIFIPQTINGKDNIGCWGHDRCYATGQTWADKHISDITLYDNMCRQSRASEPWWHLFGRGWDIMEAGVFFEAVHNLGVEPFWRGKGLIPARDTPGQEIITLQLVLHEYDYEEMTR